MANKERVVVGYDMATANENKQVAPMLDMSAKICGTPVEQLLLDAGYCATEVLRIAVERNIDILCPEGQTDNVNLLRKSKLFDKSLFVYNADKDFYTCPQGQELTVCGRYRGSDKYKGYIKYGTTACQQCPARAQCTKSKTGGREITRYALDDMREALRTVMSQKGARERYKQRQAWIEPVYSHLKTVQRLRRFSRRGFANALVEFSLHLCAYNLSRAVAFARRGLGYFLPIFAFLWACTMVRMTFKAKNYGPVFRLQEIEDV
jgi:hypothetical protein